MKKFNKKSLATMIGAAVVSSFTANVNAETDPFAMNELASGYQQAAAAPKAVAVPVPATKTEPVATVRPAAAPVAKTGGTCAEGKCGDMMKGKEGSCGDMKAPAAAAATPAKAEEGKCGQGMCGAMMENGHMKKGMEAMCGAMMKGKEGSCGDMMNMSAPATAATAPAAAPAKAMEGSCGDMMKAKEGSCGDMVNKPAAAPAHAAPVAAPAAIVPAPAKAAPVVAAPAKPAAAPAPANKVVEGQCAAVKEETHDVQKHLDATKKANAPWGNRKKIVNP